MLKNLNEPEYRYRKTIGAIGFSMIFFLLFVYARSILVSFASDVLKMLSIGSAVYALLIGILESATYLLMFMLPALLFKHKVKKSGFSYQVMDARPKLSPWLPLFVFATVLIVHASAQLNFSMITWFQGAKSSYGDHASSFGELKGYEIALELLSLCVVPGLCEEFLFRGVFLTNLIPFGKNNAILISALLFSLMHENPAQALFAFVAGILLGLIYIKTGSIWNCIIVHLINNFVSLLESIINYNFNTSAIWALPLLDVLIYVVGAISLAVLIYVFFSKHPRYDDGMYQKELPAADSYAVYPIEARRMVSLFCTPTMLIFMIFACLSIFSIWLFGGLLW